MDRTDSIKMWFAIVFLVAIPALVHTLFKGAYVVTSDGRPVQYTYVKLPPNSPVEGKYVANRDDGRRTFWIGPVSTTIPFIFLALLFIAHCGRLKSKSRTSAYCAAVMAWLGMMGFTTFLIFQAPGPKHSSTIGIAVALTPFFYTPFLFLSYIVGTIVGMCWNKWKGSETNP